MPLEIATRDQAGAAIVELKGRLDGSPETGRLQQTIRDLIGAGQRRLVLEMSEVYWANSLGIGSLISAFATTRREGGSLVLCAPTDRVRKVLTISGVVPGVLEVHEDLEAAIAATR
jgi:anti-sigma B factor antagonist